MKINPINSSIYSFSARYRVAQNAERKEVNSIKFEDLKKQEYCARIGTLFSDGVKPSDRTYDSFTGMRDKNFLLASLSELMKHAKRTNSSFSIAMFDMDNFKSVNELLSYETGDDFIKVISKNISSAAKSNKLDAYRFGGEEFVIIFGDETPQKKKKIVDNIINSINSDKLLKSKESLYHRNADSALSKYLASSAKVNSIISLRERKDILEDLGNNFRTEEAKNDSYFVRKYEDTNHDLLCAYGNILTESIASETDDSTRAWLTYTRDKLERNPYPTRQEEDKLVEYIRTKYDKTQEIYQIKKWMSDFKQNKGFSITGSVVTFTPDKIQDKSPINLIDFAGQILKAGKYARKGVSYFSLP